MIKRLCQALSIILVIIFIGLQIPVFAGEFEAPFCKVKELAITKGEMKSNGCLSYRIYLEDENVAYLFMYCKKDESVVIMKAFGNEVMALAIGAIGDPREPIVMSFSTGQIIALTRTQAIELAFQHFRYLVLKGRL